MSFGYQSDLTDPSTGLVDMTARHYQPGLGRFVTRDVITGDPQDPMTLNQFIYTADSPLTFNDPTGMYLLDPGGACVCSKKAKKQIAQAMLVETPIGPHGVPLYRPSPPSRIIPPPARYFFRFEPQRGYGRVSGGFFIMARAPAGRLGLGDNRGWDSNADADRYRAYFSLNYESGQGFVRVNASCNANRCAPPRAIVNEIGGLQHNQIRVERDGDELAITFRLVNGLAPLAAIDAQIEFRPSPRGGYRRIKTTGVRDPYPSLEIYQRVGRGEPIALEQLPEASLSFKGFDLGLFGLFLGKPEHF